MRAVGLQASALLAACSSPLDKATQAALAYTEVPYWEPDRSWPMVCPADQAAMSIAERQQEVAALFAEHPEMLENGKRAAEGRTLTVRHASMNAEGTIATVEISVQWSDDPKPDTTRVTLHQDPSRSDWCVATGWAEDQRFERIAADVEQLVAQADALAQDWKFDEAGARLREAAQVISVLPEDHPRRGSAEARVTAQQSLLEMQAKDWVGGRWTLTEETDPMTDAKNAVAMLRSLDRLSPSSGQARPATLIVRCHRGKLDSFINAGAVLDSDRRTSAVRGQHRFGDAPAEPLRGSISTSRDAVFLDRPREWAARWAASNDASWRVELPVSRSTPQTVTFDMTAASKALEPVLQRCAE
jgi:hypothetical protein